MRIIVGYECSGVVRAAFRALGHDAWSCDIKPAEDGSPYHFQDSIHHVLARTMLMWDMGIFHPVCTRLANSGAKHLYLGMKKENGRNPVMWEAMEAAAEEFRGLLSLPFPKAIENPIMHGHARKIIGAGPTQIIQPWQFGHKEMKATGLWLDGLPKLVPTDIVGPPPTDPELKKAWEVVFRMAPGPHRAADRARTKTGLAEAMAAQWSAWLEMSMKEAA